MSESTFSYVIPVHNQVADLRRTVRLLVERLGHLPGSEVILVENGSTDGSGPLCLSLSAMFEGDDVAVRVTTSAKGLGFAWRRGIAIARGDTLVLTAADLPFGFTDGLVGVDVDTQGTVIIRRALAQSLLPRLRSGDFLIGAEINCWAVREGITPVEIPVVYTANGRSTVSPLRDSTHMAMGLFALRRRLGADRRAPQGTGEAIAS
jgi:glycosyltransferase involved in cell wall biosynthesis